MPNGILVGGARPSRALRRQLANGHGGNPKRVDALLGEIEAVEGLARVLDQGIAKVTTKDGRLDCRELAAYVLVEIRRNQR